MIKCWCILSLMAVLATTEARAWQQPQQPAVSRQAQAYYLFSRARLLESKRDYEGARKAYEQAIQLDPDSSQLYIEYASLLAEINRVNEALAQVEKAIQLDPQGVDGHILLGNIYQANRDLPNSVERSMAAFEKALELDPNHSHGLYSLGRLYLAKQDFEKAAAVLERFVRLQPAYELGAYLLALAYSELKQIDKGIEALEKNLEHKPNAVRNLELLAALYEKSNQVERAQQAYEMALAANPENNSLRSRLGFFYYTTKKYDRARELYEQLLEHNPDDVQILLQLGKVYMEKKLYEEAADAFYRALKVEGDNVEVSFNLALALAELGEKERALKEFDRLLGLTRKPDGTYSDGEKQNRQLFLTHAGLLRQELGLYDGAIEAFEQLLELSKGDNFRAHLFLINTYRAARRYPQMLEAAKTALARFPQEKWVVLTHAQALSLAGKKDEGVAIVRDKIAADSKDPQIFLALGQIYMDSKDYPGAVEVLKEGLAQVPESEVLEFQLGASYERQKKYDQAETIFRKILNRNPDHAGALNYLGYMMADRGVHLTEALELIKKAVKIDPYNGAYLDSLGWAFFRVDNLEFAEKHLTKAVQIVKNDATIHEHLGDLYYKMGKYETAVEYYQKSLKHATEDDDVAKVREKLKEVDRLIKSQKVKK